MMGRQFWTAIVVIGPHAESIDTFDELIGIFEWIDDYQRNIMKSMWENNQHHASRR